MIPFWKKRTWDFSADSLPFIIIYSRCTQALKMQCESTQLLLLFQGLLPTLFLKAMWQDQIFTVPDSLVGGSGIWHTCGHTHGFEGKPWFPNIGSPKSFCCTHLAIRPEASGYVLAGEGTAQGYKGDLSLFRLRDVRSFKELFSHLLLFVAQLSSNCFQWRVL